MKKLVLIAALGVCFAGSVFAQAKPATPAAGATAADPLIKTCRIGLDTEYKALLKDHAEGLKAKKMNKAEEAEYQKTLDSLKAKWTEAMKDGANLKECTDQRAAIKTAQARLNEMQAINGKAEQACFAGYKKAADEADKLFAEGLAAKKIDAKEEAEYKKREGAMKTRYNKFMKDGDITLAECKGLQTQAENELAAVKKMTDATKSAANPTLDACLADLTKEYNALQADAAKPNANVSATERTAFNTQNNVLKTKWTAARHGGVTLQECTTQRADIKTVQASLDKMQAK